MLARVSAFVGALEELSAPERARETRGADMTRPRAIVAPLNWKDANAKCAFGAGFRGFWRRTFAGVGVDERRGSYAVREKAFIIASQRKYPLSQSFCIFTI